MKSIGASVGCFGLFLAVSAGADAGVPADSGPDSCATSDDCSVPTPYCHATRSVCVQCISNVNCFGVSLVCNQEKGVCANCASNADCFGPAPYCSTSLNACVECLTDANCGKQGIKCKDGVCGSCGDGICSDNERNGSVGVCKDCLLDCPKNNLGTKTGDGIATGTVPMVGDTFTTPCGPAVGPTVSFGWTAPSVGSFLITGGPTTYVAVLADDCAGAPYACWTDQAFVSVSKGQKVAILLTRYDGMAGPYAIGIQNVGNTCNPMFCPTGPFGQQGCCLNSEAGSCGYLGPSGCVPPQNITVDPVDIKNCLNSVYSRNEPTCMAGTDCRCNNCPVAFQTCNDVDGCRAILSCMHRYACLNADCYAPDRCAPTIDAYGGIASAAFTDAIQVNNCDSMFGCRDCSNMNTGTPDSSMGPGGGAGVPGFAGFTSGTGARGSGFAGRTGSGGATNEADAGLPSKKAASTSGGCDCGVARRDASASALSALAGFFALVGARRRRRPSAG